MPHATRRENSRDISSMVLALLRLTITRFSITLYYNKSLSGYNCKVNYYERPLRRRSIAIDPRGAIDSLFSVALLAFSVLPLFALYRCVACMANGSEVANAPAPIA